MSMDGMANSELFRWATFVITMVGVILNIKKSRWCFLFWFVANAAWLYICWSAGIYQGALTYAIFNVTCVWGWIEWKKGEANENEFGSD